MSSIRLGRPGAVFFVAVVCVSALPALAEQAYVRRNLVSDVATLGEKTNANLVNPWGLARSATGPWWVNANGTGLSLVLDGEGTPVPAANPLVVTVPPPGATGTSTPTGIVFNGSSDFELAPGMPARFIFATEDGTISGWNPGVSPTHAVLKVDHSSSAVYKGLAMGSLNGRNVVYAANFSEGRVDVFDTTYSPVSLPGGAFFDADVPDGFAPFNVQNIGGALFVTFAKQDDAHHDDVAGTGLGYVDEFTPNGTLVMRLRHGPWMNSPWAVTLAPGDFGHFSGRILVGNFGSGEIAAFDAANGEFKGLLRRPHGKPIKIDGLWALEFGNGGTAGAATTLYFSAGIQDEQHGVFGSLTAVKGKNDANDEDSDDESRNDSPNADRRRLDLNK